MIDRREIVSLEVVQVAVRDGEERGEKTNKATLQQKESAIPGGGGLGGW